MKIIYSPEFNSTSYINLQQRLGQLLGLKVCGSTELLSELELRAGIAVQELSEPERLVAHHDAIKESIKKTIFANSFAMDEIGVTRKLLNWRDNLLMAGWNPQEHRFTKKLENLAALEEETTPRSQADRWKKVHEYVKNHRLFSENDKIEVHASSELLPLVIRNTLDELNNQGFVEYVQPTTTNSAYNLKVYKFKTRTIAYQWYLSQPDAIKNIDVTVSNDNCMLNDMAISFNKPVVNSKSSDSNPQILQLFKLGLSLFARPLNVYNLLSYLQVPGHPAKGVAFQLAKVLADEGGVNEKWDEVIENYDFTNDKDEDEREEIFSNHVSDERKAQLVVLSSFCRSLVQTLKDKKTVTSEELLVAIDGIYQPQSFTHFKAEKDSPDFISSVTQIADPVDNVCWLGCVGSSLSTYPYDFLNNEEIEKLNEQGVSIPSKTEFYSHYRQLQLNALQNICQNLILVCWEYDGNELQEEHPLLTEFKSRYTDEQWARIVVQNEKPHLEEKKGEVVINLMAHS